MKKWFLLLICLLAVQVKTPILAVEEAAEATTEEEAAEATREEEAATSAEEETGEERAEKAAVRKVIEGHVAAIEKGDLFSIMGTISNSYSGLDRNGKALDYATLKSTIQNDLRETRDIVFANLTITNLEVRGDTATVEIQFNLRLFDLRIHKQVIQDRMMTFSLQKEDNAWKITRISGRPL